MQPSTYITNLEIFSLEWRCQACVPAPHRGTSLELELKVWGQGFGYSAYPQTRGYHKSFVTEERNCMATKNEWLIVSAAGKAPTHGFDWSLNQSFVDFTACGEGRNARVDFLTTSGQHSRDTELCLRAPHRPWSIDVSEEQRPCRGQAREKSGSSKGWGTLNLVEAGATLIWAWVSQGWAVLRGGLGFCLVLHGLDLLGKVTDIQ